MGKRLGAFARPVVYMGKRFAALWAWVALAQNATAIMALAAVAAVLVTARTATQEREEARRTATQEHKEARHGILLQDRREALFTALEVLDHVFANSSWDGRAAPQPHDWDLQKAHRAMNGILVYCSRPDELQGLFLAALGAHGPREKPPNLDLASYDKFRQEVAKELETSSPYRGNPKYTFIASLKGGRYTDRDCGQRQGQ